MNTILYALIAAGVSIGWEKWASVHGKPLNAIERWVIGVLWPAFLAGAITQIILDRKP